MARSGECAFFKRGTKLLLYFAKAFMSKWSSTSPSPPGAARLTFWPVNPVVNTPSTNWYFFAASFSVMEGPPCGQPVPIVMSMPSPKRLASFRV